MNIKKIQDVLDAQIISGEKYIDKDIKTGCGCDLMSHVLAHIHHENTLLLTGLTTPQVIYTTDAVDIPAVCFVRGKRPDHDTIKLAQERKIVLLLTDLPLFESCGRLYKEGLIGCSEYGG